MMLSILTHMHCLGSLSRKRPEYHCHFGVILMNVYAAVRIVDLIIFVDFSELDLMLFLEVIDLSVFFDGIGDHSCSSPLCQLVV